MAVGKASIQRAANAENKGTAKAAKTTTKTAAKATKTTKNAKTGTSKAAAEVKQSVITPENAEEIRVKFLKGSTAGLGKAEKPIGITEELPDYLL